MKSLSLNRRQKIGMYKFDTGIASHAVLLSARQPAPNRPGNPTRSIGCCGITETVHRSRELARGCSSTVRNVSDVRVDPISHRSARRTSPGSMGVSNGQPDCSAKKLSCLSHSTGKLFSRPDSAIHHTVSNMIRSGGIAAASINPLEREELKTTRSRIGLRPGICTRAKLPMSGMGRSAPALLPIAWPRAVLRSGRRSSGPRSAW